MCCRTLRTVCRQQMFVYVTCDIHVCGICGIHPAPLSKPSQQKFCKRTNISVSGFEEHGKLTNAKIVMASHTVSRHFLQPIC